MRARVVARVAGLGLGLAQITVGQRRQGEREPQANAIGRRLGGQLAEREVQAPSRLLVATQPPFRIGQRNGEREALLARGRAQRVQQRLVRGHASPAAACASASSACIRFGAHSARAPRGAGATQRPGSGPRFAGAEDCSSRAARGEQRDRLLVAGRGPHAPRGARAPRRRRRARERRAPRGHARPAASHRASPRRPRGGPPGGGTRSAAGRRPTARARAPVARRARAARRARGARRPRRPDPGSNGSPTMAAASSRRRASGSRAASSRRQGGGDRGRHRSVAQPLRRRGRRRARARAARGRTGCRRPAS